MCEKATKLDATFVKAYYRLALAQSRMFQYESAIDTIKTGLYHLASEEKEMKTCFDKLIADWAVKLQEIEEIKKKTVKKVMNQKYKFLDLHPSMKGYKELPQYFRKLYAGIGPLDYISDDENENDKVVIDHWDNSLADNMITLEEEMEAFEDKMPEHCKSSNSSSSPAIKSANSTKDDEFSDSSLKSP
ncbi:hypothetical protein Ciccas_002171 [Cichlidogyrus casuarinus]|uniref:Uncharacterized protein n=1 Tax=Cichlidogyrus casuarinus TaxID=1844966 RepID=A0ABD2QI02_9PLAT